MLESREEGRGRVREAVPLLGGAVMTGQVKWWLNVIL